MGRGQGRTRPDVSARYRVEIARRAAKAIAGLPRGDQQRVRAAIDLLADTPRPPGCVAMAGEPHAYRVRVGVYRIVYEVLDTRLLIQVVRVGHRREVYRR
jgi:mRNA interferase RelE/StbE